MRNRLFAAMTLCIASLLTPHAQAQETFKIGIIGQFSGPFADSGLQFKQGIEAFTSQHGLEAGGRKVEIIYRDVGGTNPAIAKRLAEELVVRDKVSVIGGFFLSPEASAAASVLTETKTPGVIFTAASSPIMRQSPYFVRTSQTLWQAASAPAEWARKKGMKRAYIAVADYAPGHDAQAAFKTKFTALGGEIVGEDRIPLNTVDFSPFAERIAKAQPDVVDIFIPNGAPSATFIKALSAQGVLGGKIALIGIAETDDTELRFFDKNVVGVYSSLFYGPSIDNEQNRKLKETLRAKFGDAVIPNFALVGAYDGMQIIYRMAELQKGKTFDGTKAVESVKGYKWDSPRGPAMIDAETRDIVHNMYIKQVQEKDGKLANAVIDTFPMLKDPWAELNKK